MRNGSDEQVSAAATAFPGAEDDCLAKPVPAGMDRGLSWGYTTTLSACRARNRASDANESGGWESLEKQASVGGW